jgi:hypothetical protein
VFFAAYFHVLRNPVRPVTEMPLTPLDAWIPLRTRGLLGLCLAVALRRHRAALLPSLAAGLLQYGAWATALCATGLAVLLPVADGGAVAGPPPRPGRGRQHAGFALMRGVDAAGNACPSLHVGTAMFTAWWLQRMLAAVNAPAWPHLLNGVWFLAIAWSTVAVRQHVVLDVVAGAALALGLCRAVLALRANPGNGPCGPAAIIGRTLTLIDQDRGRTRRGTLQQRSAVVTEPRT